MSQRDDDRKSCGSCKWLDTGKCPYKHWPRKCELYTPYNETEANKINVDWDFHFPIVHKEE